MISARVNVKVGFRVMASVRVMVWLRVSFRSKLGQGLVVVLKVSLGLWLGFGCD